MNLAKAKLLVVRRHWFQQGQMAEYERIIELLTHSESTCADWAIALIKGEING